MPYNMIEILVALVAIVLIGKAIMPRASVLKGLKIKAGTAALIGILVLAGGAYWYNWGGFHDALSGISGPSVPSAPAVPSGVVFSALGSESDSNLLYDANTKTFSVTLHDNTSSGALTFENVTLTLTVYRSDTTITGENPPVCSVGETSVPTFQVVGDANTYSPVALTSLGEWNITVTPASGSALYQVAYGTVSDGGSKAFTVVVHFSYAGVHAATDGTVYSSMLNAAGTTFILNMVIGAAVT